MSFALPKFQFRFVPSMGNVIHPGNFHPVGTQRAAEQMIARAKTSTVDKGKTWIVVGGSGGFGSAARVVLGSRGASTLNVSLDATPNPESSNKIRQIGSPGFHRNLAIERKLRAVGTNARSIQGDAFSPQLRDDVVTEIREHFDGKIHGIVFALATPRATDHRTGKAVSSALRPVGKPVRVKTFTGRDPTSTISEIEIPPGSPEEAIATIFVMGGAVVRRWIDALLAADVLADGFTLLTISYRGNPLNEGIYRKGLIGLAKADLEFETAALDHVLQQRVNGRAIAVEGPAVVTEASGGIPGVPFYMAHAMDVLGPSFEDPLANMQRMFDDHFTNGKPTLDAENLLRMDDRELAPDIQTQLESRFAAASIGDAFPDHLYDAFMTAYARTRGFDVPGVDYHAEFDPQAL